MWKKAPQIVIIGINYVFRQLLKKAVWKPCWRNLLCPFSDGLFSLSLLRRLDAFNQNCQQSKPSYFKAVL